MIILGTAYTNLQLVCQIVVEASPQHGVLLCVTFHVVVNAHVHPIQAFITRRNHIMEADIAGEVVHRIIHVTGQRRRLNHQPGVITIANDDFHGFTVSGRVIAQREKQCRTVAGNFFRNLLHFRTGSKQLEAGAAVVIDAIQAGQSALCTAQVVEFITRIREVIPPHQAASVFFDFGVQLAATAGIVAAHRGITGDRIVICGIQITAHFVFGVQILVGVVGQRQVSIATHLPLHEYGGTAINAVVKFVGHIRGRITVVAQPTGAALHLQKTGGQQRTQRRNLLNLDAVTETIQSRTQAYRAGVFRTAQMSQCHPVHQFDLVARRTALQILFQPLATVSFQCHEVTAQRRVTFGIIETNTHTQG